MTPSEEYVSKLCEKSFLPFWSYLSPLGKKGKELCDILIVCGNDIVIISVKDIRVSNHPEVSVKYERWYKKAITGSIDQIFGAERFIETVDDIILNDRETTIKLANRRTRAIYRIAVAFGSNKDFPLESGDFGNGFIHVFDEESTFTVINELDTFPDFINYLKAKEEFAKGKRIMLYKEVDFLAFYLKTALELNTKNIPNVVTLDRGLWDEYIKSKEYNRWQQDIQISLIWDEIVNHLFKLHIQNKSNSQKWSELEIATRIIALECRNNRIVLGEAIEDAIIKNVRARIIKLEIDTQQAYVYLKIDSKNWEYREKELELRCLIARKSSPTTPIIIGIAIGVNPQGERIFDYAYFNIPELSKETIDKVEQAKHELGFFTNTNLNKLKPQ